MHAAAFTSVSSAVKRTLQINGFKGPFQGLFATIVRNAPANSVYLGSFEVGWHTYSALTMLCQRPCPQAGHAELHLFVCVANSPRFAIVDLHLAGSIVWGAVFRDYGLIAALAVHLHSQRCGMWAQCLAEQAMCMQVMKAYEARRRGVEQKDLDSLTVLGAAGAAILTFVKHCSAAGPCCSPAYQAWLVYHGIIGDRRSVLQMQSPRQPQPQLSCTCRQG